MKFSKKLVPFIIAAAFAIVVVFAPAQQAEAATYPPGFYIEMNGQFKYYNAVQFAMLSANQKNLYVLDSAQFVYVDNSQRAATADAIFASGSVSQALTSITPGLIRQATYNDPTGTPVQIGQGGGGQTPVQPEPEPEDFEIVEIS